MDKFKEIYFQFLLAIGFHNLFLGNLSINMHLRVRAPFYNLGAGITTKPFSHEKHSCFNVGLLNYRK